MGNEKADTAAKSGFANTHIWICLVSMLMYPTLILNTILTTWQDDWHGVVASKFHSVKPVLGDWQSTYKQCRMEEVVLCLARIAHTHLTHSYILRKDPPPECEHCQYILTVRHFSGVQ